MEAKYPVLKLMHIYSCLFSEFQDTDVMQAKHILVAFPLLQPEFKPSKITCLLHLTLFNIYYAVLHFPFWVMLQELILKWTNEAASGKRKNQELFYHILREFVLSS